METEMRSLFSNKSFQPVVLAIACLALMGSATSAQTTSFAENILYIGSADDYFRYTTTVEAATGQVNVTGTLVFHGGQYGVVADGVVRSSGVKSPPRKRFVVSGAANVTGLGAVTVSDAYGATREEAVTNFVNNVVAGVIIRLL
jgi:hypothetical protein